MRGGGEDHVRCRVLVVGGGEIMDFEGALGEAVVVPVEDVMRGRGGVFSIRVSKTWR